MVALISLFVILTLSILCTRIVTVALTLTGLSREAAQFQSVSAFTGAGFTTTESEKIVNHPVRRRIILLTIRLGNVGLVTTISSLILTFVQPDGTREEIMRLVLLLMGLVILWGVATSHWIDHHLSGFINWALRRWSDLDTRDYASLLRLSGEYKVVEIQVQAGDWLVDKSLAELNLNQEGALVLGIYRANGNYIGAPTGETVIHPDDILILYGRSPLLVELDSRQAGAPGDQAHQQAVLTQERIVLEQKKQDWDTYN